MSTFKNKNSLRTIEAQIVQKLKNNEARPKFTGSYKMLPRRIQQFFSIRVHLFVLWSLGSCFSVNKKG